MVKNKTDDAALKKRKHVPTTLPPKAKKQTTHCNISFKASVTGSQGGTPSKTPTFRQPQKASRLPPDPSRSAPGSSRERALKDAPWANINLDRDVEEAISDDDEKESDSSDEEDGERPNLTQHIKKLLEAQRNIAIGKAFTLKYWPWPDQNVEQTRGQRQTGRNDLPGRVRELLSGWWKLRVRSVRSYSHA